MSERWGLRGSQIRADGGNGQHVGTYYTERKHGLMMAAAPELLDMLEHACGCLDAAERHASRSTVATDIEERLVALGLRDALRAEETDGGSDG